MMYADRLSEVVIFESVLTICKALFTRDILTHNIAMKRYCDKKIFSRHRLVLAKIRSYRTTNQGNLCFIKSLPWLVLKSMAQKYLFITISFYRNIVSRVNKA